MLYVYTGEVPSLSGLVPCFTRHVPIFNGQYEESSFKADYFYLQTILVTSFTGQVPSLSREVKRFEG
jgi:hypothetical protein